MPNAPSTGAGMRSDRIPALGAKNIIVSDQAARIAPVAAVLNPNCSCRRNGRVTRRLVLAMKASIAPPTVSAIMGRPSRSSGRIGTLARSSRCTKRTVTGTPSPISSAVSRGAAPCTALSIAANTRPKLAMQ